MPGSKGLNPHELAHKWMKDLGIRSQYEPKSGMTIPRYANNWEDCGSATHGTIRGHHSWGLCPQHHYMPKLKIFHCFVQYIRSRIIRTAFLL